MTDLPRPPGFRGGFLTGLRARAAYSEGAGPYRIVPRAVAVPAHREDVQALVRYAGTEGIPLTPRGAGSGMPGGNLGSGVVVDLRKLDRPCRVSLQGTANVGAAVTWKMLDDVAGHFGFRLPPDPSSGAVCTLGGMVATNAAGARSLRAGSIREWVRGVEFVSADGEAGWLPRSRAARKVRAPTPRSLAERLRIEDRFEPVAREVRGAASLIEKRFPHTRKNSSGYALDRYLDSGDLVDLVIGSEGTLGIITRVELTLERRPDAAGTLLLGLRDLEALGTIVPVVLEVEPSAVELLDRSFLEFVTSRVDIDPRKAEAVLLIELEDRTDDAVGARLDRLHQAVASDATFVRRGVSRDERERLWDIRHAASPLLAGLPDGRRSLQVIEDGCVPVARLSRYVRGVRDAARRAGVEIIAFGHAGDGHVHVNALVDASDASLPKRLTALLGEVTELLVSLGGTPSGEHGDGRLRTPMLERFYGADLVDLFRQVKAAFDPAGIFNPGVIVNGDEPPIARLKVGPGATAIPEDIADALRRIERSAAWGQSPLAQMEDQP
jgi:FAD/FMN-containing dehydrogenase